MREIDQFEEMENYLKNRLSVEAKAAFEARMRAEPDLAESVELHRDMLEAVGGLDLQSLRVQMDKAYKNHTTMTIDTGLSTRWGGGYTRLAAAASVALILVAGIWWFQQKPEPIIVVNPGVVQDTLPPASKHIQESPDTTLRQIPQLANEEKPNTPKSPSVPEFDKIADLAYEESAYAPGELMGEDIQDDSLLAQATGAYNKKEYKKVIKLLQVLPVTNKVDALKLRAHAAFNSKQYYNAAIDFEELRRSRTYKYDAEWYLLLSYFARMPNTKSDFDALYSIVSADTHPFSAKAKQLKKRLR